MLNRRIILGIFVIALVVAAAYGTEYVAKKRAVNTATIITMQNNGQTAAFLGINVLRQLDAEGPRLTSVLTAAGIDRFSTVEIKGLRNSTVHRLQKHEINKDMHFVFTDRGTVNLSNKQAVLVEDVNEINAVNE